MSEEKGVGSSTRQLIRILRENWFLLSTLCGVIIGGLLGYSLRSHKLSQDTVTLISYPGELYLRALKLMILPFVSVCITTGTATLNVKKNGMIAVRTAIYFFTTTLLSTAIGIILSVWIHPGSYNGRTNVLTNDAIPKISVLDNFLDIGRNIIPDNIFSSTFESTVSKYAPSYNGTHKIVIGTRPGTNMLGVVLFFALFGSVLGGLGQKRHAVIEFFTVIYDVFLKILLGIVGFTPIAVGSIICGKMYSVPDIGQTFNQLAWFIVVVLCGLAIHEFVLLQVLYFAIIGSNPFSYYKKLLPIIFTAFATSSKSACLPISFNILENRLRMSKKIVRFVLPLGSLNLNGAGLFMVSALIFIAQMNNVPLTLPKLISLLITVSVMTMSMATIPSASLVTIVMLCGQINAPVEDVSLLYAIDWFLDRCRTTNNIAGDCYAVAILQKLSESELKQFKSEENVQTLMLPRAVESVKIEVERNDMEQV